MTDLPPASGQPVVLRPDLTRVIAPNPSPMTYWGTNTYLVGRDTVAIVDPGPQDAAHMKALIAAVGGRPVTSVIVSHSHVDHAPLARPLADHFGVPVVAFGTSDAGRSEMMRDLAARGIAGGGEGVDHSFQPDVTVAEGDRIIAGDVAVTVHHTPGHMGNHIALAWHDTALTGDTVMGWASSLVSPPDGDLTDFLASCARLRSLDANSFHAGHGAPITAPAARLEWLIDHRNARTAQIVAALQTGPATAVSLTAQIYTDVPVAMHVVAARNVFAHLLHLVQAGQVRSTTNLSPQAFFKLT